MSEFTERLAADTKRVETWAKQGGVTAAVVAHALNPLAGPAAQQADLTPVKPLTEVSQDIQRKEQEDWKDVELQRLKQEAGELQPVRQADRAQARQATSGERARQARRQRER